MCTNTCTHLANSAKTHRCSALKGQQPFKQFIAKSLVGLSHLGTLTPFVTNTLIHAHNSCSSDSHEWQHESTKKGRGVELEAEQENWRDTESSRNKPILMRCHFISHISSLLKKKIITFFKSVFTEVGRQGSLKRAEKKKRAGEQQREGDQQKGRDESERVRSGVICRAERKCAATLMVWMFARESREWWEIKRGDRQIQQSLQHNGQLLLFLLTDRLERGSTVNPSLRLQNPLTNSWNCNCANFCINAGDIFKDRKACGSKIDTKTESWETYTVRRLCSETEPLCSRLIFSEKKKIQVRNTRMHIHTTGIEDRSQVIKTLTSSNCSLKCLPPDWPKGLSNGSSNKPCHMLLDDK